jgi:hypothetical protein
VNYNIARNLPREKLVMYKEVERLSERSKAWQAVSNFLNKNNNLEDPLFRNH